MTTEAAKGSAEARNQGRRRPIRERVRSESQPTSGSVTASHTRAASRMDPTSAGLTSSTSVENLSR